MGERDGCSSAVFDKPTLSLKPAAKRVVEKIDVAPTLRPVQSAFPHHCDAPAGFQQFGHDPAVPLPVAPDLGSPKGPIGLRRPVLLTIMSMIKA